MPDQTTLAHELITTAARDLATFMDVDNPNRISAGRAALSELDAAILTLQRTRQALFADLRQQTNRGRYYEVPGIPGNAGLSF